MTLAVNVQEIFRDAREVHAQALERLAAGDIRDAAEKAWCAAKRATDALILARTGEEVERTTQTSLGLKNLRQVDPRVRELHLTNRYYHVQGSLHGDCFYLGHCDPEEDEALIRDVARYIADAERLAES